MKTLPLTDHTERFKLLRASYAQQVGSVTVDIKSNSDSSLPPRVRNVDKIDKVLTLIDQEIIHLSAIVDDAYRFDSKIDESFKLFKACSDNINLMSNSVMGVVKAYEKPDPLVYMHYVLLIKEKLQKTEQISSRFRKIKMVSDEMEQYYGGISDRKVSDDQSSEYSAEYGTERKHGDKVQLMKDQERVIEMERVVGERELSIQQVSRNMAELHQQFVDIQIMVAMQGEQIGHIDENIIKSLKYADEGVQEIVDASKYNEKANKTKRRVVGTLVVSGAFASLCAYAFKKLKL